MRIESAGRWATLEFGASALGDIRRTRRVVAMAGRAARRPSGKVSVVFDREKEREGAYDFLESPHVDVSALTESMCSATAERARLEHAVYVAIDGTSLTLTDGLASKGFGPVGSPNRAVRGLMVMNALAVSKTGTPLGLIDQQFWVRPELVRVSRAKQQVRNNRRPFEDKHAYKFVKAAESAARRLSSVGVTPWIIIDREGDNRDVLHWLSTAVWPFTIRATWDRRLVDEEAFRSIRASLESAGSLGSRSIELSRNGRRAARTATVDLRAREVMVRLRSRGVSPVRNLTLNAVLVQESGAGAGLSDAIEWLLLSNVPIETAEQAWQIVDSYRARWRIEEFHRTWKRGQCNIEEAQLRSPESVMKWATILSAVAMRIERLKYMSRFQPDTPADVEFEPLEIEALRLAHRSRGRDRGLRPRIVRKDKKLTNQEATQWLAVLGGWMGEKRSGLPGSVTLGRGLDRLAIYTQALSDARAEFERDRRAT